MLLSIDVGIKNLAMCLMDPETRRIEQWDVSGVPPESSDGLFVSLRKHIDERAWVLTATVVLIEKQPDRNRRMKQVENFLHAYCVIKNPSAETIIYDARHKIPDVSGAGKSQYKKRKETSIKRCHEFITTGPVNEHWVEEFNRSKKKDDLADTVMQGLSFLNRRVITAPAKARATKITARRPTEHQRETKYSKSNLVWLYREGLHTTDKRFTKDLKRYWKTLDDFCDDIKSTTAP